ncbi:hypothetical protein G6F57_015659 [Rhizopus arrhizus]|nr:hypothetical protein G6F57_015659 [Rhizopus arrhizus]
MHARAYQTVPYVMWGEFKPVFAVRGLKHTELIKNGIPVMWNIEKPHGRRRGRGVPADPPVAGRSGCGDRRRQRDRRGRRENPAEPGPGQAAAAAVRHLDQPHRRGRPGHLDVLADAGIATDRPTHGADRVDRPLHDAVRRAGGSTPGRAGCLERRPLAGPPGDDRRGLCVFGAGVPDRLQPCLWLFHQAGLAAGAGLQAPRGRPCAVPAPPGAALPVAGSGLHGAADAHDARHHAGGPVRGLHPHRARQGPVVGTHRVACVEERRQPHRHHHRRGRGPADWRRRSYRNRVRDSRPGPPDHRRRAAPRLPGDPGRVAGGLGHLRADQPPYRPAVPGGRSSGPLLMMRLTPEAPAALTDAPQVEQLT